MTMTADMDPAIERCGACGEPVSAGSELCPRCGALLAAYRTPALSEPPVVEPPAVPETPSRRSFWTPEAPPEDEAASDELTEARRRLLRVLLEPKRDLVRAVELIEARERTATRPPAPARPSAAPAKPRATPPRAVMPQPRRPQANAGPTKQPLPKRPGYVVRGTVEPVLVIGIGLFLLACFIAGIGSLADSSAIIGIGLVAATVGLLMVVGAVLVALVRRDSDRR